MTRHVRACVVCPYAAGCSSDLKKHMWTHGEGEPLTPVSTLRHGRQAWIGAHADAHWGEAVCVCLVPVCRSFSPGFEKPPALCLWLARIRKDTRQA